MNSAFLCCSSSHTFSALNSVDITRSLLSLSSSSNVLSSPYALTNSLSFRVLSPYPFPQITSSAISLPRLNPRQRKSVEGIYIVQNLQIFLFRKTTHNFAGVSKTQTFCHVCYLLRRGGHYSQLISPNRRSNLVKPYTHTRSSSNCPHTKQTKIVYTNNYTIIRDLPKFTPVTPP